MNDSQELPVLFYKAKMSAMSYFGYVVIPILSACLIYVPYSIIQYDDGKLDHFELFLLLFVTLPAPILGLLFLLLLITNTVGQVNGKNGLIVNQEGFCLRGWRHITKYEWKECTRFEVGFIRYRFFLVIRGAVFHLKKHKKHNTFNKRIAPAKVYGLQPEELTNLLNTYRDKFHSIEKF